MEKSIASGLVSEDDRNVIIFCPHRDSLGELAVGLFDTTQIKLHLTVRLSCSLYDIIYITHMEMIVNCGTIYKIDKQRKPFLSEIIKSKEK